MVGQEKKGVKEQALWRPPEEIVITNICTAFRNFKTVQEKEILS